MTCPVCSNALQELGNNNYSCSICQRKYGKRGNDWYYIINVYNERRASAGQVKYQDLGKVTA